MNNRTMAAFSLIAGIILMFAGMIIAPMGIIHESVLYGTGQLFILCATLAGCSEAISKVMALLDEIRHWKRKDIKNE